MTELVSAGLLQPTVNDETQSAYQFIVSARTDTYEVVAIPKSRDDVYEYVGTSFYLDESGVIRWAPFGKPNGIEVPLRRIHQSTNTDGSENETQHGRS
jgi:hypothetical protein